MWIHNSGCIVAFFEIVREKVRKSAFPAGVPKVANPFTVIEIFSCEV